MAPEPRDPRNGPRQSGFMALVTLLCLVLVSAYSAVFQSDALLWSAWAALALSTAALFVMRCRRRGGPPR